mgnify:CR=1 FL=1
MTDATPDQIDGAAAKGRLDRLRAGLKRRHAKETRFKWYGRLAIAAAMIFLAILMVRIVAQGHTAFYTHTVTVPVYMDPARVDRAYPQGSNFEQMAAEQQLKRWGIQDDAAGDASRQMKALFSSELKFVAADLVAKRSDVIGETVPLAVPLSDEADLYLKGEISKETPEDQRRLTDQQLAWLDRMQAEGVVGSPSGWKSSPRRTS